RGWLTLDACFLFVILFLWQMPHFLAIAWLCREDYARAGYKMLPVLDPTGRSSALQSVVYASALLPCSFFPAFFGLTTPWYLPGAAVAGVAYLILAVRFYVKPETGTARPLFWGSIVYLPVLLGWLVFTKAAVRL
ncbi:MAG: UbiA family prenyltransferase, partial [Verrucomicrobiae bacterium]|nr:UbiA family prenyltransferase [Verrucomicrobiae bacterium]